MKYYLGVDLGGTNVRVAKVDENGSIVEMAKSESDGMAGPEVVLKNLFDLVKSISGWQECSGIGIGVPGPVETVTGTMTLSTNLKGFTGFPLKSTVEKELNLPAFIDNDANVAGLAESLVGAGAGEKIVYYNTISTGIGGALIVDGKVISGARGYAGEVGNIIVDRNGPEHDFGTNRGCMEAEAGGRSMEIKSKAIWGDRIQHTGNFFELCKEGDKKALEMLEKFTEDLAIGFSAIAHVADPSCFVIGGGMLKSKDVWFDKFKEKFYARVHKGMRDIDIRTAKIEEPGLIGAAMLPVSHGV